jgi:hypothetical protein
VSVRGRLAGWASRLRPSRGAGKAGQERVAAQRLERGDGPGEGGGPEGGEGRWAGRGRQARGRGGETGRERGAAQWEGRRAGAENWKWANSRKILFKFLLNFGFGRTLENCTRRF